MNEVAINYSCSITDLPMKIKKKHKFPFEYDLILIQMLLFKRTIKTSVTSYLTKNFE